MSTLTNLTKEEMAMMPKDLYYNLTADKLVPKGYPKAVRYVREDLFQERVNRLLERIAEMEEELTVIRSF